VTLILVVGTCNWYVTHRLMMMHVSMKFQEILKDKAYLTSISDLDLGGRNL